MNSTLKRYLISSLTTFLSVFTLTFGALIQTPGFVFGADTLKAALVSAIAVAVRAVWKLIVEWIQLSLQKDIPTVDTGSTSTNLPPADSTPAI